MTLHHGRIMLLNRRSTCGMDGFLSIPLKSLRGITESSSCSCCRLPIEGHSSASGQYPDRFILHILLINSRRTVYIRQPSSLKATGRLLFVLFKQNWLKNWLKSNQCTKVAPFATFHSLHLCKLAVLLLKRLERIRCQCSASGVTGEAITAHLSASLHLPVEAVRKGCKPQSL